MSAEVGLSPAGLIVPDWPAPPPVRALFTTRRGGVGVAPYESLNLGAHVGDDTAHVAENRRRLAALLPRPPVLLNQVHGVEVAVIDNADAAAAVIAPKADAVVTRLSGRPCAVLVADCLPVLLCDAAGDVVGAAHAGWRGLAAGVIEATVTAMKVPPRHLMAWLGPAIGPSAFEVGAEVRQAFLAIEPAAAAAFAEIPGRPGKFLADIFALARQRLQRCGVPRVYGGGLCTVASSGRFFSYRRDGVTGRMAAVIWRE
jgi:polyphenol oxidase